MAEEGMDGTDVGAALEEVGEERMAEGVAGGSFGDVGFADGIPYLSLQRVLVDGDGAVAEVDVFDKLVAQGRPKQSTARIRTACKAWRNCRSAMPVERPRPSK